MIARVLTTLFDYKQDKDSLAKSHAQFDALKVAAAGAAAFVVGKLGAGLFDLATEEAALADQTAKAARNFGIQTSTMSELDHAAQLSGLNFEQINGIMKDLGKNSLNASRGNKDLRKEFRKLGIDVKTFAKLPVDQQLEQMADAMQGVTDKAAAASIRMKLMGEAGLKAGSLFAGGAKGIRSMRQEAQDLGFVIDDEFATASENMNDNVLRAQSVFRGLQRVFAAEIIPVISEVSKAVSESFTKDDSDNVREFGRTVAGSLRLSLMTALDVMIFFKDNIDAIKVAVISLGSAAVLSNVVKAGKALRGFLSILSGAKVLPFLALAAAIGLVYVAIDDLNAFIEGRDSALGTFLEEFFGDAGKVEEVRKELKKGFDKGTLAGIHEGLVGGLSVVFEDMLSESNNFNRLFNQTWGEIWNEFSANLERDAKEASDDFQKGFVDPVLGELESIGEGYNEYVLDPGKKAFEDLFNFVSSIISKMQDKIDSFFAPIENKFNQLSKFAGNPLEIASSVSAGSTSPAIDTLGSVASGGTVNNLASTLGGVTFNVTGTDAVETAREIQRGLRDTTSSLLSDAVSVLQNAPRG